MACYTSTECCRKFEKIGELATSGVCGATVRPRDHLDQSKESGKKFNFSEKMLPRIS